MRCIRGHLVVLTSQALLIATDFVQSFLEGRSNRKPFFQADVEAVDLYVAFDRFILLEFISGVVRLEIDAILSGTFRDELQSAGLLRFDEKRIPVKKSKVPSKGIPNGQWQTLLVAPRSYCPSPGALA